MHEEDSLEVYHKREKEKHGIKNIIINFIFTSGLLAVFGGYFYGFFYLCYSNDLHIALSIFIALILSIIFTIITVLLVTTGFYSP